MIRQEFERFISSPQFEKDIERFPNDGTKYPWPGAYRDITVELAWECWREATSMQIARMESRLAEAESKIPRWIPVSEGLPKECHAVLICKDGNETCYGYLLSGDWYEENEPLAAYDITVTHWMPLPEAPKSEEEE